MENKLSPKQSLVEIYKAVRSINATAEQHEALRQLIVSIDSALPKEDEVKEEVKKK